MSAVESTIGKWQAFIQAGMGQLASNDSKSLMLCDFQPPRDLAKRLRWLWDSFLGEPHL